MKKHWLYLKYVVRHKYFVWVAGRVLGVSVWRLLIHDWTKFLPCEWGPYVDYFYGPKEMVFSPGCEPSTRPNKTKKAAFDAAWNHHQKQNKHHFQYYILNKDDGGVKTLQMPYKYAREMLADWMGAGRAITGKWDVWRWYEKNKDKMQIHSDTRAYVEELLEFDAKELLRTK